VAYTKLRLLHVEGIVLVCATEKGKKFHAVLGPPELHPPLFTDCNLMSTLRLRLQRAIILLAGAHVLSACGGLFGGDCATVGTDGIAVTVIDSTTNLGPVSRAVVLAADGAFQQEKRDPDPGDPPRYRLAPDRAGLYSITVRAQGYQEKRIDNVRVSPKLGACGGNVETVELTVRIVPLPQ
jgi:hypothetical protein